MGGSDNGVWYMVVLATDALDGLETWKRRASMNLIKNGMVIVLIQKGGRRRETQRRCRYFVEVFDDGGGVQWELVLAQFATVWLETWKGLVSVRVLEIPVEGGLIGWVCRGRERQRRGMCFRTNFVVCGAVLWAPVLAHFFMD